MIDKSEWEAWRDIDVYWRLFKEIDKKYHVLVILAFSCAKWSGDPTEYDCAFCEYDSYECGDCKRCLIVKKTGKRCIQHPLYKKYSQASFGSEREKHWIDKIYSFFCSWYEEEYRHVFGDF